MKFTKMQGCGNDYVYVNGMEDGRFAPKENLTRAQAAVVMNNLK